MTVIVVPIIRCILVVAMLILTLCKGNIQHNIHFYTGRDCDQVLNDCILVVDGSITTPITNTTGTSLPLFKVELCQVKLNYTFLSY